MMQNPFMDAPLTPRQAGMVSPIRLAYVGDAVHDLLVRSALVLEGGKANAMHRAAVGLVNAAAQARALSRIAPLLTEEEADIVRRGRNAHGNHSIPKRVDPADYSRATGLESLFGYLFLTGRMDRLSALYREMQEER